jgi:Cu+-exporting ATPase
VAKVKCNHCGLEFDESVMIKDNDLYFCCKGCEGVYYLLKSENLEQFYEKKGDTKLNQAIHFDEDASSFDAKSFYDRFVTVTKDGFYKINLIIEGIHCAACVWLNEKVLDQTPGIVEANINFTNNKAVVIWDNDTITLAQIIQTIRNIGYNAYPYEKSDAEQKATKAKRDYFLKMSVAIFTSMNLMMIDIAKYSGYFYGMDNDTQHLIHFAEFIFASIALFYSGQIFFKGAYYGIKNKFINMDLLVISGAVLSYTYSLYVLFGGKGQSYFDSAGMIITFV